MTLRSRLTINPRLQPQAKTNTDLFPEVRPSFEEKREALIRLNMTGCLRNLRNHLILKSLN